jgi:hypothetical protein
MGRKASVPNRVTRLLKDAILMAGENAGGKEGLTGYLGEQAKKNPAAYLTLLGRVLPMQTQITGDPANLPPCRVEVIFVAAENGQPLIEGS